METIVEQKAGVLEEIDSAIALERKKDADVAQVKSVAKTKAQLLGRILRGLGALTLIAASSTFLLQRWDVLDHVGRYFSFLGFIGILTVLGFISGLKLADDKAARTFLSLALGFASISLAVLGGLTYSAFATVDPGLYPAYAYWKASTPMAALIAAAVGIPLLGIVAGISFTTLARKGAGVMTLAYLASGMALLIPTRDPAVIGLIAFVQLLGTAYLERRLLGSISGLKTTEGHIARGVLYLPFLLLVGRTLALYNITVAFVALIIGSIGTVLFVFANTYVEKRESRGMTQFFGSSLMSFAWFIQGTNMLHDLGIHKALELPLVTLPIALLLAVLSLFTYGNARYYRDISAMIAIGTVLVNLCVVPSLLSAFLALVFGVAAICYGIQERNRWVLGGGVVGFLLGNLYYVREAVEIYAISPWVILAVVGVGIVLLSTMIEKYHRDIKRYIDTFQREAKSLR